MMQPELSLPGETLPGVKQPHSFTLFLPSTARGKASPFPGTSPVVSGKILKVIDEPPAC